MHRGSIRLPGKRLFQKEKMPSLFLWGFRLRFQSVSPGCGQVIHVLLTRSPLNLQVSSVRLACIRHAASVHPEPGSNSPFDIDSNAYCVVISWIEWLRVFSVQESTIDNNRNWIVYCRIFKEPSLWRKPFPSQLVYLTIPDYLCQLFLWNILFI